MSDANEVPATASFFIRLWREKPLGAIGGALVLILIIVALFADVLAPYPHYQANVVDRLQGPSTRHLLGTDQLGRDLLSRLIYGARISLLVGLAVTTMSVVVSTVVGGVSGFLGGRFDLAVQRFVDAWMSFPGLLLLLTMMSIVGRGVPQIILVMGIAGGIGGSRVIRSAVVAIREYAYFQAAQSIGCSRWGTLSRHVLPNIMPVIIVSFSISIGGVIMGVAALSFLGYGLPLGIPEWGGMLSREGRIYMEAAPRLALWPGLCLTVTVYSLNMLGDAVRDLLDPRLRGGGGRLNVGAKHDASVGS